MSNELANLNTTITQQAEASVMDVLKRYSAEFAAVIPKQYTASYFGGLVKVEIAKNPKLAGCTAVSFVNAVLTSASLGLPIRKNSAYLIPYGRECQLVIDYHGKMDLARRAGVGSIHVQDVRVGDDFYHGYGPGGLDFRWTPGAERGEITRIFACAKINGDIQYTIMTLAEIEGIRRRAKSGAAVDFQHYGRTVKGLTLAQIREMDVATMAFNDPYRLPWVTDYDRMARKTVLHRAAHDWPLSPQLLISQELDVANDTGTAAPLAPGMDSIVGIVDPADNRPMVDGGGDTREEQKESAAAVGAALLEKAALRKSGPPMTKSQVDAVLAKSKRFPTVDLPKILFAHSAATAGEVRQSDYESVMAMIDEAAG